MAGVVFTVDTSELNQLHVQLSRMMGQFEWITARAMTKAAYASREAIRREILPMVQGGATPWTQRGLTVQPRFAKPDELRIQSGFQYGNGKFTDSAFTRKAGGVPAGRYMGINAGGGDRRPKGFELALRRAGQIGRGDFVVPRSRWGAQDARGNISGGKYQQILSRVRALPTGIGSAPTGAGSRGRSGRARASLDYFVARGDSAGISRWQLGTNPVLIAERAGPGPKGGTGKGSGKRGRPKTVGYKRGFIPAMSIVPDAPNYERRFPIQSVAMREYRRVFPAAWRDGFLVEAKRRR
jgi:hypothetical protein